MAVEKKQKKSKTERKWEANEETLKVKTLSPAKKCNYETIIN